MNSKKFNPRSLWKYFFLLPLAAVMHVPTYGQAPVTPVVAPAATPAIPAVTPVAPPAALPVLPAIPVVTTNFPF